MQPTQKAARLISGVVAGRSAPATTRCGCHPPVARREAPHNQRIHLTKSVHDPYRAHAQICR